MFNKTSSAIWIKLAGKTRCIRGIFLANVITFNLKISGDLSKYIHKILELFFINYSLVITSNHFLHFTCSELFPQAGHEAGRPAGSLTLTHETTLTGRCFDVSCRTIDLNCHIF